MENYSNCTVFVGIDNGSTGSVGIIVVNRKGMRVEELFMKTPTYRALNYHKTKRYITLINYSKLRPFLRKWKKSECRVVACMERPFTQVGRYAALVSGMRIHQQWLDLFEFYGFAPPTMLDSRQWQKLLLPKGVSGEALKHASRQVGSQLFPQCAKVKHPDCDGMLICEYARRIYTGVSK